MAREQKPVRLRGDLDGLARVRAWVDASPVPLDAWIIERETLDANELDLLMRGEELPPVTPPQPPPPAPAESETVEEKKTRESRIFGKSILDRPSEAAGWRTDARPNRLEAAHAHWKMPASAHAHRATTDARGQ